MTAGVCNIRSLDEHLLDKGDDRLVGRADDEALLKHPSTSTLIRWTRIGKSTCAASASMTASTMRLTSRSAQSEECHRGCKYPHFSRIAEV